MTDEVRHGGMRAARFRGSGSRIATKVLVTTAAGAFLLAGCGDDDSTSSADSATSGDGATNASVEIDLAVVAPRLEEVQDAIDAWAAATTIEDARAAAETAHNLVSGTATFVPADRDGDGTVGGEVDQGLLPSEDGTTGLVSEMPEHCDLTDVLGGDWSDPAQRWAVVASAIDAWTPTDNTFPSLPSHPQRIVGWSALTLASDDLDEAHEYAGHARLHLDVTRDAIDDC